MALLTSALFVLSIGFTLFNPSTTSAAPDPNITPARYAKLYNAARTLIQCDFDTSGYYAGKSGVEIDNGEVFEGRKAFGVVGPVEDVALHSSFLVDGADGRIACESGGEIEKVYAVFGKSGSELLEDMGIYKLESNSVNYRITEGDKNKRRDLTRNYMIKEYGIDTGARLTPAAQYAVLINAFDKKCKGAKRESGGTEITRVDNQGKETKEFYSLATTDSQPVGFGIAADGDGDQEMQCSSIAEAIRSLAPEYKARVLALVGRDVNVDDGSNSDLSADNNPSCESTGLTIAWIICPFINALAESADFMFNNLIRPLLVARDIGYTDNSSGIFQVWSAFRSMANILLILALIVVVFGQALGGGMIDAYTAKKVLPRIFAVAILINISIYLVVLALDFANIVGAGINSLIYAGFEGAGEFKLQIGSGAAAAGTLGIGAVGAIGAVFAVGAGGVVPAVLSALPFIALFVILPAVLIAIAIFVTLVIRQGIIILLVIIAPIALAAYVLPNTERFFKQWWSLLFKTLMVYPIVMIIFAIADVMAVVVSGTLPLALDWLGDLIAVALLVIPLLLIPFAFKLAGGAIGSLYGTLSGFGKQGTELIKGDARNANSLRNRVKRQAGETMTRGQSNLVQGEGGRTYRNRGRALVGRAADLFGNVDQRMSTYNAEAAKRREELSQSGDDSLIYAGAGWEETDPTTGAKSYYDSKGRSISAQAFRKGKSLYGSGQHDIGQALAYTLSKAQSDEDLGNFRKAFTNAAVEQNWSDSESMGVWASATYPNKGAFGSEWYSTPSVVKNAEGRTEGMQFKDVSQSSASYKKMVNDFHKNRQTFELGKIRDVDWRAMADHQSQVQERIANGTATNEDITNYAQTSEVIDTMISRGMITQNPDGEVSVAGASAASQPVIQAMIKNAKYGVTNAVDASGNVSADWRNIYDKGAVETARASHDAAVLAARRAGTTPPPAFDFQAEVTRNTVHSAKVTGDADRSEIPRVI